MALQNQVPMSILIVCILATAILTVALVATIAYLVLRSRRKSQDYEKAAGQTPQNPSLAKASPPMDEMPYVIDLHRSYAGTGSYVGGKSPIGMVSPIISPGGVSDVVPSPYLLADRSLEQRTEVAMTRQELGGGRKTPIREMPGCTTWSKQDMSPPPAVWNSPKEDRLRSQKCESGSVRSSGAGWG